MNTTTTAMPVPTTAASAFNAARGQGGFGRYGFDGVSKPLASTASMQSTAKPSVACGWAAKLYPSDYTPKSLAGKVLLAPLGLLMLAGAVIKPSAAGTEPEAATGVPIPPGFESVDDVFLHSGVGASMLEDVFRSD